MADELKTAVGDQAIHFSVPAPVRLPVNALTGMPLIDGHQHSPSHRQTVVIRGTRIAAVFPDGTKHVPDSASILQLPGKYLLPGLTDTVRADLW